MDQTSGKRDPTAQGSTLCADCGLCCRGALHRQVRVEEHERQTVETLGLEVRRLGEKLSFALPCPLLKGTLCSVYDRRPITCRTYACYLLKRVLSGEMALAGALATVRKARLLVERIDRAAGGSFAQIWHGTDTAHSVESFDNEARLDAGELLVLLRREFLPPEGREA